MTTTRSLQFGAELLIETARMWAGLGFYDGEGRFHLFTVTGPDEYTTVVNDNTYTNLMARMNLNYAATVVDGLRDRHPDRYDVLCHDLGLAAREPAGWRRAAAAMHVPYDPKRGINPQDAQFLEREPWDFDATQQRELSAAVALPPTRHLPAPGPQTSRRGARHVPLGQ